MLLEVLDQSTEITTFGEGTNRALHNHRLRSPEVVESVVRRGPAPVTAMKPICDSHLADVILDQQMGSRAIWIWRNHIDTSRSALVRWGNHQAEVLALIRSGRVNEVGWRGERIPTPTLELIRSAPMQTSWDGAVLMWYLRTSLYFSLNLESDQRVLPVNYDRLLEDPAPIIDDVFSHAGASVPDDAASIIKQSNRHRPQKPEELSDEVHDLALALTARLEDVDEFNAAKAGASPAS